LWQRCTAQVGAQSSVDESQLRDNLKSFTNVYALVEQNYAEPIAGDKADAAIYDGAIPGMLQVLDPHSISTIPRLTPSSAKISASLLWRRHGDSAAEQQGLRGHALRRYAVVSRRHPPRRCHLRVDGKPTDGWSSDQVAKALKDQGHACAGYDHRVGQAKPLVFDLVRDEIPILRLI